MLIHPTQQESLLIPLYCHTADNFKTLSRLFHGLQMPQCARNRHGSVKVAASGAGLKSLEILAGVFFFRVTIY